MKPLIAVVGQVDYSTGRIFLDGTHLSRISSAGGVPAVFTVSASPEEVLEHADGILLIEGPDVHPRFYGEDPSNSLKSVDVRRDEFEIKLVKKGVERGIPVLGIARGMHIINVALGGTLYQDLRQIPKAIKHDWELSLIGPSQRVHGLRIKMDTKLYEALKEELDIAGTNEVHAWVNSFHHQAVKKVGDGLRPAAFSVDGLIEAIEGTDELDGFVMGVQWQPEYLPEMSHLYSALVKAASLYQEKRLELERVEIEAQVREELSAPKEQDEMHHSLETSDSLPDTNQT